MASLCGKHIVEASCEWVCWLSRLWSPVTSTGYWLQPQTTCDQYAALQPLQFHWSSIAFHKRLQRWSLRRLARLKRTGNFNELGERVFCERSVQFVIYHISQSAFCEEKSNNRAADPLYTRRVYFEGDLLQCRLSSHLIVKMSSHEFHVCFFFFFSGHWQRQQWDKWQTKHHKCPIQRSSMTRRLAVPRSCHSEHCVPQQHNERVSYCPPYGWKPACDASRGACHRASEKRPTHREKQRRHRCCVHTAHALLCPMHIQYMQIAE